MTTTEQTFFIGTEIFERETMRVGAANHLPCLTVNGSRAEGTKTMIETMAADWADRPNVVIKATYMGQDGFTKWVSLTCGQRD